MNHLTDDEITGFVSFDTLGNESMELASRVNYHILRCEECRERVRISQKLYDEAAFEPAGITEWLSSGGT